MTIEVFIKKPEKVEVLKYDGTNYDEVIKFAGEEFQRIKGCFVKGDYIIKGVKGEFYPCKPDVFEATYDEYTEQQNSNRISKPSSFSLRDLVMQIAPKHIKYYVKRLEEYGFKLELINEALIGDKEVYLPFIFLKDKNCNDILIVNQKGCYSMSGHRQAFELRMAHKIIENSADGTILTNDYDVFEVDNNNWRKAFNKLVASFPDEIMKNTNHHTSLTS